MAFLGTIYVSLMLAGNDRDLGRLHEVMDSAINYIYGVHFN